MLIRAASLALAAFLAAAAGAQERLYTEAELQRVEDRAVPNIRAVFSGDIIGNLPRDQRARAAQVRLEFPPVGPSPMAFYADPVAGVIYMPLSSIRFFDDVATLFSWAEGQGCDPAAVQAYLWRKLRRGEPLPAPLKAFKIDREKAINDPFAGNLSAKIYSSGLQFILAHELGHVMLEHRGGMRGADSQAQEVAADDFAMDHFARLGGLPMGVFWYYMAAWWMDPLGDEAREAHTHPVSPERISHLGSRISADPMAYSHGELDPAREAELAAQLGAMITQLADLIEDDGMLSLMPVLLERDWPAERLPDACP